jgi:hypothetical protein
MSSTLDARDRITAGLEAGGIRASTTGQFAAPCVLVEPGDPWSSAQYLPRRVSRWRLTIVAGRADSEGALELLGELIDSVDIALLRVDGCELPQWGKPFDAALDGIPYAASVGTVQLIVEG